LHQGVLKLERLAREMDREGIGRKLRELVPEYQLSAKVISFRAVSWTDGGKRVA